MQVLKGMYSMEKFIKDRIAFEDVWTGMVAIWKPNILFEVEGESPAFWILHDKSWNNCYRTVPEVSDGVIDVVYKHGVLAILRLLLRHLENSVGTSGDTGRVVNHTSDVIISDGLLRPVRIPQNTILCRKAKTYLLC